MKFLGEEGKRLSHQLSEYVRIPQSGCRQDTVCWTYQGLGFLCWQGFSITLAAVTQLNPSRTSKWVWGTNDWLILLRVLRRSRSSHVWRLCRASEVIDWLTEVFLSSEYLWSVEMVRFSCFNAHVHSHKPKKQAQPSFETMLKMLQSGSQNTTPAKSIYVTCVDTLAPEAKGAHCHLNNDAEHAAKVSSVERGGNSEEINCKYHVKDDTEILKMSRSVGCELDNIEDFTDQGFSCCESQDCNAAELSVPIFNMTTPGTTPPDQDQEVLFSESPYISSDQLNYESFFSFTDPQYPEKDDHENSDTPLYVKSVGDSSSRASPTPMLSKSSSMPNFAAASPTSGGFDDLKVQGDRRERIPVHDACTQDFPGQGYSDLCTPENSEGGNAVKDDYGYYDFAGSSKDWIIPVSEEIEPVKNLDGESSSHHWDQLPGKDFKLKRINDWVVDLQHCSPVEETNEIPDLLNQVTRGSLLMNGMDALRVDAKINPGMEAAKRCISSLNPAATSAQLANHGLVVIPFLSAFVSLKVLNLAGNSIVRITAGALPRGLHLLNLSKNKISTIEGLRELTRLRILDLSYNKIVRIGHGLASCSSLKELYLAGNKISEVEGLHRLLKLTTLDLAFNKISTSKCLGQLAANYNSLQVISLEGNPAQKNLGDEQLKKQLQGLLPKLSYNIRQPVKSNKDSSDRSLRLGTPSHQLDRGLRSDYKSSRRGSHSVAALKQSSLSTIKQKGQVTDSPKRAKGKHGHLPPSGTKTAHHHHQQQFDFGSKVLSLGCDLSIHKSRSEGSLAAL
ncbi:hypothetical protein Nepgr_014440 [Nepenthes gracilis]|uniref:Uncharacterized protein n=1 Tax=Nepenthes gracilis TaxID=150966 RepID=A0AAD3XQ49_NEPGR|nr:hypothetical protein Nepgr_014440 [Nepenthes gracilis]